MNRKQVKEQLIRNIERIIDARELAEKSNTFVMIRAAQCAFDTLTMVASMEDEMDNDEISKIRSEIERVLNGVLKMCTEVRRIEQWPDVFGDYRDNHGDWDSGIDPPDLPIAELEGKTRYRLTLLSGEEKEHRKRDEEVYVTTRRDGRSLPETPPRGCFSSEFVRQIQKSKHPRDRQPSAWTKSKDKKFLDVKVGGEGQDEDDNRGNK